MLLKSSYFQINSGIKLDFINSQKLLTIDQLSLSPNVSPPFKVQEFSLLIIMSMCFKGRVKFRTAVCLCNNQLKFNS